MVKEVVWTPEAKSGFQLVIDYLLTEWSEKEVNYFLESTIRVIGIIIEHPRIFRKTSRKNIHEALITPHNIMMYRVGADKIEILLFWDTRRNPKRKRY